MGGHCVGGRGRRSKITGQATRKYRTIVSRMPAIAFVKSAAYVSEPSTGCFPFFVLSLPTIRHTGAVLYGRHDPLVPPANADVLENGLPRVSVVPLNRPLRLAGHRDRIRGRDPAMG